MGLLLGLAACDTEPFSCFSDADCDNGDVSGICQADGWCSFYDRGCDSHQRYGKYSADILAGTCVPLAGGEPIEDPEDPSDRESPVGDSDDDDGRGDDGSGDDGSADDGGSTDDGPADPTDGDDGGSDGGEPDPTDGATSCPEDSDLLLCVTFDSVSGSGVADEVDPGLVGELLGDAEVAPGPFGDALTLPGNDGYLDFGQPIDLPESFTVQASFILSDPTIEWQGIVDQWMSDQGIWIGVTGTTNTLSFWVDGTHADAPDIAVGQWVRVAGTFDAPSGTLRLYVNGQQVATTVHDGPMTPPDVDLVLGYHQADDVWTGGQIDDVRLWGRVLGPEEL